MCKNFGLHSWEQWSGIRETKVTEYGEFSHYEITMARKCTKCGWVKTKTVKA